MFNTIVSHIFTSHLDDAGQKEGEATMRFKMLRNCRKSKAIAELPKHDQEQQWQVKQSKRERKHRAWLCVTWMAMQKYSRGLKSKQICLNVDKPFAEKSPRPGHSRVAATIKTQGGCLHRIQSTSITITREPTPHTADSSSASTTLHYKQSFCQNGLIWMEWTKENMKREEVTVCEKAREEDKKRNKQRTQMKTSAENC